MRTIEIVEDNFKETKPETDYELGFGEPRESRVETETLREALIKIASGEVLGIISPDDFDENEESLEIVVPED